MIYLFLAMTGKLGEMWLKLIEGRGKAALVQAKLARITAVLGAVSEGGGGEAGHPGV